MASNANGTGQKRGGTTDTFRGRIVLQACPRAREWRKPDTETPIATTLCNERLIPTVEVAVRAIGEMDGKTRFRVDRAQTFA